MGCPRVGPAAGGSRRGCRPPGPGASTSRRRGVRWWHGTGPGRRPCPRSCCCRTACPAARRRGHRRRGRSRGLRRSGRRLRCAGPGPRAAGRPSRRHRRRC
ncbi:hypothetical protein G6F63_016758 [Rhizopus arrhizus]|nr:hypothetical protein G6F63_016758 [Rhizopus arrhizus]